MEEKKMITIKNADGSLVDVEILTYLISDDGVNTYIVYSKGEKTGVEVDEVIYLAGIALENNVLTLKEIKDDNEWLNVQKLLKKIANA